MGGFGFERKDSGTTRRTTLRRTRARTGHLPTAWTQCARQPGPSPDTLNHNGFDDPSDRLYGCKHRGDARREIKDGALQRCCPKVRYPASFRRDRQLLDTFRHIGPQRIFASSARGSTG